MGDTLRALEAAYTHAVDWVESVPNRPVAAAATAEQLLTLLDGPLPAEPTDPAEVINMLAATAEKGLVATPSDRFFGFVVGGALPTALAADWLTSAWEQNAAFAALAPTEAAVEAVAARWVTDCLGLPATRRWASPRAPQWPTSPAPRSAASGASSLCRRISPARCSAGSSPGSQPTRLPGRPCCGPTGASTFRDNLGRGPIGSGIARR
jgi:hypothetical protein